MRNIAAELVPVPPAGRPLGELATALASLPRLGVEEAEAFGRDLEQARREDRTRLPGDPWVS